MWVKFAKAVFRGEHKLSPWTYVATIATIIYTIWPLDVLPDYLLGPVGMIDDLGLWGVLAAIFRWEMGRFEKGVGAKAVTIRGTATRDAN
jgi:uncharacterized membrane protein YkvA (DUF1232 family)